MNIQTVFVRFTCFCVLYCFVNNANTANSNRKDFIEKRIESFRRKIIQPVQFYSTRDFKLLDMRALLESVE